MSQFKQAWHSKLKSNFTPKLLKPQAATLFFSFEEEQS